MSHELDESLKEHLIDVLTNELSMLRAKVGLSQQELANRMGVSRQTYGAIEIKNNVDMAKLYYFIITISK